MLASEGKMPAGTNTQARSDQPLLNGAAPSTPNQRVRPSSFLDHAAGHSSEIPEPNIKAFPTALAAKEKVGASIAADLKGLGFAE